MSNVFFYDLNMDKFGPFYWGDTLYFFFYRNICMKREKEEKEGNLKMDHPLEYYFDFYFIFFQFSLIQCSVQIQCVEGFVDNIISFPFHFFRSNAYSIHIVPQGFSKIFEKGELRAYTHTYTCTHKHTHTNK